MACDSNVGPMSALHNAEDSRFTNVKGGGQDIIRMSLLGQSPNLLDFCRSELSTTLALPTSDSFWVKMCTIPLTRSRSALNCHIFTVLSGRASKQMRSVATQFVVAGMASEQWGWINTRMQEESQPMDSYGLPSYRNLPIPSAPYMSAPRPTLIRFTLFDIGPESQNVFWNQRGEWQTGLGHEGLIVTQGVTCP